jgi:hypothetical protein
VTVRSPEWDHDSAIQLINGLATQIAQLPDDAAAIAQRAADVQAKSDALATE